MNGYRLDSRAVSDDLAASAKAPPALAPTTSLVRVPLVLVEMDVATPAIIGSL